MLVERILSIGIVIFATFFLIMSLMLESRSNVQISPSAWPIFLTSMMIILGIVLIVRNFKKQPINTEEITLENKKEETVEDLLAEDELMYPKNFIYLFITLIVYAALLGYLGFIMATFLVNIVIASLFGMRKWSTKIITSIVSTTGFIILFPILLHLPFPRGVGIFRTISLLFY
ncbi:tripartite tricarboxylate transporter TctB family protein [bacterium LRH843]|nr:tripartite tricarboxylate transporter TctB family protein [bacterium LRH843]